MNNQIQLLSDLLGQSEFKLVDHYLHLLAKNSSIEQRVTALQDKLSQSEISFEEEKTQYLKEIECLKQEIIKQEKKHIDENLDSATFSKDNHVQEDAQETIITLLCPENMTDGYLNVWHVDAGEIVSKDEVIFEIETDTAILEIIAPENGFIKRCLKGEGDIVYIGDAIAEFICTPDSYIETDLNNELAKGVWVDPKTQLMWARISIGQVWKNGKCLGNAKELMLGDAERACKIFDLAGYDDWRLPNIEELKSLIDEDNKQYCYKKGILFNPLPSTSGWYWSSTYLGNNKYAYVNLYNFHSGEDFSNNYRHVRAVRSLIGN